MKSVIPDQTRVRTPLHVARIPHDGPLTRRLSGPRPPRCVRSGVGNPSRPGSSDSIQAAPGPERPTHVTQGCRRLEDVRSYDGQDRSPPDGALVVIRSQRTPWDRPSHKLVHARCGRTRPCGRGRAKRRRPSASGESCCPVAWCAERCQACLRGGSQQRNPLLRCRGVAFVS